MKERSDNQRRKILAEAVKETKKLMGIDVEAIAKVQDKFNSKYDKILPEILEEHVEIAEQNSQTHRMMLDKRYSDAKKFGATQDMITAFPRCWCDFINDFLSSSICDHSVPLLDVDSPSQVDTSFDCITAENKAKPFVMLKGGGDGIDNSVTLVSRIGFNINDTNFSSKRNYCITPTTLLSGYW